MTKIINDTKEQKLYNEAKTIEQTLKDQKYQLDKLLESQEWYTKYEELKEQEKEIKNQIKEYDKRFNNSNEVKTIKESMKAAKEKVKWKKEQIGVIAMQNYGGDKTIQIFDEDNKGKNLKVYIDALIPTLKKEKIKED